MKIAYKAKVTVIVKDEIGMVQEIVSSNDLTEHGMETIFNNLVGITDHKFQSATLGYMDSISCESWRTAGKFSDVGTPIFTAERLRYSDPVYEVTHEGYKVARHTLNFAITKDEAVGETFNSIGLYMTDGKMFALTHFNDIVKSDNFNLVVSWEISFIQISKNTINEGGFGMLIRNMIPGEEQAVLDEVEVYDGESIVSAGEPVVELGEIGYSGNKMSMDVNIRGVINEEGTISCDKIVVKAGEDTFATVDFDGGVWQMWNTDQPKTKIRNAFTWMLTVSEELTCEA
ncbi:MAG: hypothetical protein SVK08_01645 [Halobacteriota archaeon]|nr:hypothetical protein [Halobacteriota archaeon]